MDEDIRLMLQVKQDDLESFEKLYSRYSKAIYNFFYRLGANVETCEDYVQEVFMRIWRARFTYEPRAKFTTFLFQIAKNYWINESEKRKRRPNTYHLEHSSQNGQGLENQFVSGEKPEETALSRELQEKIYVAVSDLKESYRMVFVLSEFQGMKYKEIAEVMDIPIGTVKSRMATAEAKLREKLQSYVDKNE